MGRFAHITLGKAGSQWVKDVLTDPQIFAAQGLAFHQPRGAYSMAAFATEPDGTLVAPAFHVSYEEWRAFSRPDDRCVVVLRDPRDSIVSWAFSVAYSHVTEDHVRIIRPALLSLDLRGKLEVATYTFWESADVQRSWAAYPATDNECVYRYEDLVADELGTFRSMIDHFGWTVHDEDLREVVARLTFARRTGGRARGEKDPFSHYRNGVPGDWRNYFDRDLAERFENACPGLVRELGYESSDEWWRSQPETIPELGSGASLAAEEGDRLREQLARTEAELDAVRAASEQLLERCEQLERAERTLEELSARIVPARAR